MAASNDPRRKKVHGRRRPRRSGRAGREPEGTEESPEGTANNRADATTNELEERIEEALSAAQGHAQKAEEFKKDLVRLQAEFDNYRKRQAREFRRLCNEGKRALINELLPVIDNFDRAATLREEGHGSEEILTGMFQTVAQMHALLLKEGLEEIRTGAGDPFDPNIHEAMVAEELEDADTDLVLEVFQKGYLLENELLRPARVKVGRAVRSGVAAGVEDPGDAGSPGGGGVPEDGAGDGEVEAEQD